MWKKAAPFLQFNYLTFGIPGVIENWNNPTFINFSPDISCKQIPHFICLLKSQPAFVTTLMCFDRLLSCLLLSKPSICEIRLKARLLEDIIYIRYPFYGLLHWWKSFNLHSWNWRRSLFCRHERSIGLILNNTFISCSYRLLYTINYLIITA